MENFEGQSFFRVLGLKEKTARVDHGRKVVDLCALDFARFLVDFDGVVVLILGLFEDYRVQV